MRPVCFLICLYNMSGAVFYLLYFLAVCTYILLTLRYYFTISHCTYLLI